MSETLLMYQAKALSLPTPEREYRFHHSRKWRADFAWPAHSLLVEVEGGSWIRGRHQRPKGFENDCRKYNAAACCGFTVLRFTTDMVKSGEAINVIESYLQGDV